MGGVSKGTTSIVVVSIVAILVVGVIGYVTATRGFTSAPQNTISLSGTGSTSITPDLLVLSLGVQTQAITASDALASNTRLMNQVVDTMMNADLADSELSTGSFSIQAVYNYSKDSAPVLAGYMSINTLTITTHHIDMAGRYIDQAVSAGANQVNFVYFTVSDQQQKQVRGQLLSVAVADAKTKAENALTPLDLKILGVQGMSVSEGNFPIFSKATQISPSTPILPGQQSVSVTVQISFLIGPK